MGDSVNKPANLQVPISSENHQLIDGRFMTCPQCLTRQDIFSYVPLNMAKTFIDQMAPIYKCRKCRWLFAPNIIKPGMEMNGHK
jgi:rubredoxin